MRIVALFITIIYCNITFAQNINIASSTNTMQNIDSNTYIIPDKKPWRVAAISTGINLGIFGFNRFVTKEHFAYINLKTINRNLRTVPVWDTDMLSTNFIGHPYHGSLYFTAARANDFSFYESIPFTLGGSLMWEYLLENEPPSLNDLISTPIGGPAVGEVTFRLTDLILDNRSTGINRVLREVLAGIIAPTRAINRFVTGEAWRKSRIKGNYLPQMPLEGKISIAGRSAIDNDKSQKYGVTLKSEMEYGDAGDEVENPYEWFDLKLQVGMIASKFSLTQIKIIGALRTLELYNKNNWQINGGIFQHLNYFNPKVSVSGDKEFLPYYIAETSSLGAGVYFRKEMENLNFSGKLYVNGIALGASKSDYFRLDKRDYNIGSGFSLKAMGEVDLFEKMKLSIKAEDYNIYSWKGYDKDLNFDELTQYEISHLDTQGERSVARLYYLSLGAEYDITPNTYIGLERNRYIRHTRYKVKSNVKYAAWDNFMHIGYKF